MSVRRQLSLTKQVRLIMLYLFLDISQKAGLSIKPCKKLFILLSFRRVTVEHFIVTTSATTDNAITMCLSRF